jgi:general stress protein YciG
MTEQRKRGFAALDPKRRREIASLGGQAAHECGTAHQFTSAEARNAGRKGGAARAARARERREALEQQLGSSAVA